MTERERFEAWWAKWCACGDPGEWDEYDVLAWNAWRARAALDRTEQAVELLLWLAGELKDAGDYGVIVLTNDEALRIEAFLDNHADPSGPDASGEQVREQTRLSGSPGFTAPAPTKPGQSGGGSAPSGEGGAVIVGPIPDFIEGPSPCTSCGSPDPRLMQFAGTPPDGWRCPDPFHDETSPSA